MPVDLLITDAQIVTPAGVVRGAVAVRDGTILRVQAGESPPDAVTVIDARGRHLLPGVVDVHVHFREPGQEYKATYASESRAAAAGGVTTVVDMPNNGDRAIVDLQRFEAKRAIAASRSYVDFGINAYLVSADAGELRALAGAGVTALKWDMSLAGVEVGPGRRMPTAEEALPYFLAAAAADLLVIVHAEDRSMIQRLTADLKRAGRLDARAHVEARPVAAEAVALEQALALVRQSGARLHVAHLSSARGLELVRAAKDEGLAVTAETIPPFLFLDADDYDRLGTVMKIHPAVKYRADRDALWSGLRDGSIDCLATDHAPHTRAEKLQNIWESSPGAIGVQTSLPLMLNAVHEGAISLARCCEVMCSAPARLFTLPRKGAIAAGADADLVLADLERGFAIAGDALYSPNHLTPYEGLEGHGTPMVTLLRGTVVAREGAIEGPPRGMFTAPTR